MPRGVQVSLGVLRRRAEAVRYSVLPQRSQMHRWCLPCSDDHFTISCSTATAAITPAKSEGLWLGLAGLAARPKLDFLLGRCDHTVGRHRRCCEDCEGRERRQLQMFTAAAEPDWSTTAARNSECGGRSCVPWSLMPTGSQRSVSAGTNFMEFKS